MFKLTCGHGNASEAAAKEGTALCPMIPTAFTLFFSVCFFSDVQRDLCNAICVSPCLIVLCPTTPHRRFILHVCTRVYASISGHVAWAYQGATALTDSHTWNACHAILRM